VGHRFIEGRRRCEERVVRVESTYTGLACGRTGSRPCQRIAQSTKNAGIERGKNSWFTSGPWCSRADDGPNAGSIHPMARALNQVHGLCCRRVNRLDVLQESTVVASQASSVAPRNRSGEGAPCFSLIVSLVPAGRCWTAPVCFCP